jgi:uncharacterized protein YutE (UPF0331/DUF86 family)
MDDVRLQQKLEFMERQAGAARDHAALYHRLGSAPEDALRAAVLGGVTYALQTALQAMIDVAYHVCAKAWRTACRDGLPRARGGRRLAPGGPPTPGGPAHQP